MDLRSRSAARRTRSRSVPSAPAHPAGEPAHTSHPHHPHAPAPSVSPRRCSGSPGRPARPPRSPPRSRGRAVPGARRRSAPARCIPAPTPARRPSRARRDRSAQAPPAPTGSSGSPASVDYTPEPAAGRRRRSLHASARPGTDGVRPSLGVRRRGGRRRLGRGSGRRRAGISCGRRWRGRPRDRLAGGHRCDRDHRRPGFSGAPERRSPLDAAPGRVPQHRRQVRDLRPPPQVGLPGRSPRPGAAGSRRGLRLRETRCERHPRRLLDLSRCVHDRAWGIRGADGHPVQGPGGHAGAGAWRLRVRETAAVPDRELPTRRVDRAVGHDHAYLRDRRSCDRFPTGRCRCILASCSTNDSAATQSRSRHLG
jgi:hypothetical protein